MKKQKSKIKRHAAVARKNAVARAIANSASSRREAPAARFFSHVGMSGATYRGLLNGLHVLGYPFTHRVIHIDPAAGSVRQAFEDVGDLLNEAMREEDRRIGSKTGASETYPFGPTDPTWRHHPAE